MENSKKEYITPGIKLIELPEDLMTEIQWSLTQEEEGNQKKVFIDLDDDEDW